MHNELFPLSVELEQNSFFWLELRRFDWGAQHYSNLESPENDAMFWVGKLQEYRIVCQN
jgi:hypothetical protein